ncbi:hypothetical protein GR183_13525 [Stappia sp. GBMRC 2046]|uniref:TIGR02186 family protein n=1 Tax=Stappia sediminis TaxID=2692190 RepID=A0A7X3LVQ3_9HYPH|nr:TIGR02186 family protein [Stappia sediminis]MXN65928.1 hypothetical protein [Stappia sediminis]
MRRLAGGLVIAAALLACASAAKAESLIAALSSDKVKIESNFTGTEIVVFGEIARDAATVARAEPYDLAIIVTGPPQRTTVRRKGRFLGLWVNRDAEDYRQVPGFYAAHLTRPSVDMATRPVLEKLQIGLHNVNLPIVGKSNVPFSDRDDFRDAFLRLRIQNALYAERIHSIEFLSQNLFRTTIPLPSNVPVGEYKVTTYLLRGGALLAAQEQNLTIAKTGFEQLTFSLAHRYAPIYGAAAVMLALLTGWLAGVVFRKD